jgi:hypothetical protein
MPRTAASPLTRELEKAAEIKSRHGLFRPIAGFLNFNEKR